MRDGADGLHSLVCAYCRVETCSCIRLGMYQILATLGFMMAEAAMFIWRFDRILTCTLKCVLL